MYTKCCILYIVYCASFKTKSRHKSPAWKPRHTIHLKNKTASVKIILTKCLSKVTLRKIIVISLLSVMKLGYPTENTHWVGLTIILKAIVHQLWIYNIFVVSQRKKHFLWKVHLDKTTLTRNNWENRVLKVSPTEYCHMVWIIRNRVFQSRTQWPKFRTSISLK